MAKRTGAQIIWECLVHEGVQTVFGYPGGAILPAYDAMLDYPVRHVLVRHEQGATHMADGYARASGKIGVAIATSGPGARADADLRGVLTLGRFALERDRMGAQILASAVELRFSEQ